MLRPQGLFPDRQGALVERLGLGVATLIAIEFRQVVEAQALPSPLRQAGTKGVRLAAGFFATAFLAAVLSLTPSATVRNQQGCFDVPRGSGL
jgi:hypothetical protein